MDLVSRLLITPPSVKGSFWYKTVVMVVEHHSQGSIGLVLNKRSDLTINKLGERMGIDIDIPGYIYNGGPVSQTSLSMIHTSDWSCTNTLKLNDEFSLSSAKEILPRLANGDQPAQWRLFFGMAGWHPQQLYQEIAGIRPFIHDTSWCLCDSSTDLVFNYDSKLQWNAALEKSAEEFAQSIEF